MRIATEFARRLALTEIGFSSVPVTEALFRVRTIVCVWAAHRAPSTETLASNPFSIRGGGGARVGRKRHLSPLAVQAPMALFKQKGQYPLPCDLGHRTSACYTV